jgi:hypothetical protein
VLETTYVGGMQDQHEMVEGLTAAGLILGMMLVVFLSAVFYFGVSFE